MAVDLLCESAADAEVVISSQYFYLPFQANITIKPIILINNERKASPVGLSHVCSLGQLLAFPF